MLERLGRAGTDVGDQSLATIFGKQLARARTFAREKFGDQVLSIDYRATIDDASATARRVAKFLGRDDLDIDAMVAGVDSHLYHERVSRLDGAPHSYGPPPTAVVPLEQRERQ
jgi:hypothetical protein